MLLFTIIVFVLLRCFGCVCLVVYVWFGRLLGLCWVVEFVLMVVGLMVCFVWVVFGGCFVLPLVCLVCVCLFEWVCVVWVCEFWVGDGVVYCLCFKFG